MICFGVSFVDFGQVNGNIRRTNVIQLNIQRFIINLLLTFPSLLLLVTSSYGELPPGENFP